MGKERRRHVRSFLTKQAFAALGKKYTKVGRVNDISQGGLSFEYIVGEDPSRGNSSIDIFLVGNSFHLHDVPCKVVYEVDIHIPYVNDRFASMLTTRRCGVKFIRIGKEQKDQIGFLIESK